MIGMDAFLAQHGALGEMGRPLVAAGGFAKGVVGSPCR